ncbi:MAG: bifunctional phosphopantothenoylcysteine decarboxylase/phosphopantothenate--cysteine ligase CoaBC [Deltaproteobacteria bacterium]|nr:bifunctional phosphopantothenoylcysteine decarboxylase/phosphopantothenate--cysteine ligase CoaBC [Deltaproteobacteria bacterium]
MDPVLWPDLKEKRILLAVSGGIAAYKAAELCRLLIRCGAHVQVVMTRAAREFVGEATFAALSGEQVATRLFDPQREASISHIELTDEADLLLLAPATANLLAQMAGGLASDLVTTLYLAFQGPVVVAPAMNVKMWAHVATQQNAAVLRERGHLFVGPAEGEMACGHVGAGRMSEPEDVLLAVGYALTPSCLKGRRVLITAGSTREPLDSVRFIANHSSGKMGFALAVEAAAQGAEVTLVAGPGALEAPAGVAFERVGTAEEMATRVLQNVAAVDVIVMAAAVADYRPLEVSPVKLKKEVWGDEPQVTLERTQDILQTLGERFGAGGGPVLVGFAAESAPDTASLDTLAREKLARKRCHLLVANDISRADAGFAGDSNRVVIYAPDGSREDVPLAGKRHIASRVLAQVVQLLEDRRLAAGGGRSPVRDRP